MTNTPIAAKLAEALRVYLDRAKLVRRGVAESVELIGLENELFEALREYDDAKGRERPGLLNANGYCTECRCEPCQCDDEDEQDQPVAQAVPWEESDTPPDCPTIVDTEPVKLMWRDAVGRRCTIWRSAQQLGEVISQHQSAPEAREG